MMFEKLIQSLSVLKPYLGDSILLFTLAVGVTFTLIAFTLMYLVGNAVNPVKRRLMDGDKATSGGSSVARNIERAALPFKGVLVPKSAKELTGINKRLMYAGYRGREAVTVYFAIKILLTLGLGILCGFIAYALTNASSQHIVLWMIIGALIGFIGPSYYLDKRIAKRHEQIINAFPDVLDLIVACSEAGLGLNAALQRVGRETRTMYPILSGELELVNSEIRAGVDRVDALRGLSDRTGIEDISGFVSMISQSVKFGTSIADTLRIYADEFRDRRIQRAEEQAAKVATKLIFPLVFCIFPAFFVVSIGPAVISVMRVLSRMQLG